MTGRGGGGGRRVLVPPINFIFKLLQSVSFTVLWAYRRSPNRLTADGSRKHHIIPNPALLVPEVELHATVSVWLYEQLSIRIEGKIRGFDEFMNLVIDDAVEVKQITKTNDKESRRPLGQILLKGDNVSLIQSTAS
ncbi:hypothetical protein NW768_005447 [Fusarium equiseti]|uniref:Small nuclear ribonucleoprotein E n=1 Tax=Fusarium equiseti TaxID=61235 RepID=A0ABQ8RFA5_FUSEQ|nr:hypothetical protein NW768_005447 [Fusarium equiseti]